MYTENTKIYSNLEDLLNSLESRKWSDVSKRMLIESYLNISNQDLIKINNIRLNLIIRGDKNITISTVKEDRNLVTLTMNKTRKYLSKIEVRDNGPHECKQVTSINEIASIFSHVKEILSQISK